MSEPLSDVLRLLGGYMAKQNFAETPHIPERKIYDYIGPFGVAHWIFKCFPLLPTPINPALFALGPFQVVSMYRKEDKISIL